VVQQVDALHDLREQGLDLHETLAVLAPASAIWKILDSASSSNCPTSLPMRFSAPSAISVETSISFRRTAHSRTISA